MAEGRERCSESTFLCCPDVCFAILFCKEKVKKTARLRFRVFCTENACRDGWRGRMGREARVVCAPCGRGVTVQRERRVTAG